MSQPVDRCRTAASPSEYGRPTKIQKTGVGDRFNSDTQITPQKLQPTRVRAEKCTSARVLLDAIIGGDVGERSPQGSTDGSSEEGTGSPAEIPRPQSAPAILDTAPVMTTPALPQKSFRPAADEMELYHQISEGDEAALFEYVSRYKPGNEMLAMFYRCFPKTRKRVLAHAFKEGMRCDLPFMTRQLMHGKDKELFISCVANREEQTDQQVMGYTYATLCMKLSEEEQQDLFRYIWGSKSDVPDFALEGAYGALWEALQERQKTFKAQASDELDLEVWSALQPDLEKRAQEVFWEALYDLFHQSDVLVLIDLDITVQANTLQRTWARQSNCTGFILHHQTPPT